MLVCVLAFIQPLSSLQMVRTHLMKHVFIIDLSIFKGQVCATPLCKVEVLYLCQLPYFNERTLILGMRTET